MIAEWIYRENLKPFLMGLGWLVDYPFDSDDWTAISHGVGASDGEAGRWYEYEFAGRLPARLRLAHDPGTSVVRVHVEVPAEVEPQVRITLLIFQHFHVRDGTA
jgi:hypothetical protein